MIGDYHSGDFNVKCNHMRLISYENRYVKVLVIRFSHAIFLAGFERTITVQAMLASAGPEL